MSPAEFARICEWDAKVTWPENTMFGTTIDRRRLIEYVKELSARDHCPCEDCKRARRSDGE